MGYSTVLPMFGFGGDHAPVAPPTAQFNPPPAGPVGFPVPTAGAPSTAPKLPPLPTPTGANVPRLPESIAPPVLPKLPAPSGAKSAGRRVGKSGVRTVETRWAPLN